MRRRRLRLQQETATEVTGDCSLETGDWRQETVANAGNAGACVAVTSTGGTYSNSLHKLYAAL